MTTGKRYSNNEVCAKDNFYSGVSVGNHVKGLIKNRRFISEKEWKEKGEPVIDNFTQTHQPRKVINTKTEERFNTIKEAAKSIVSSSSNLSNCIKHKKSSQKTNIKMQK